MRAAEFNAPAEDKPTVPEAYRAWAYWVSQLDGAGYQVRHAKQLHDRGSRPELVHMVLCEVYARAVFETILGQHFDGKDSHADMQVAAHIQELFSAERVAEITNAVGAAGVLVYRSLARAK